MILSPEVYCIGAPLARLELKHALSALLKHLPDLRLEARVSYHPKNVFRYPEEVPVAF